MSNGRKFLLALVAIVVLGLPALAQERKGAITGTVKDSGNSALHAALLQRLPLATKLVTDNPLQFPINDVSQSINAGSATVAVFEAAYLQHLSFLRGWLGGFGISANYGYTYSRATSIPGRSDHPRLLRSAPNTWNVSPTYDRGRLSMRLGLSYNQANIFAYQFQDGTGGSTATAGGLNCPNSDNTLYSHLEIDAQGSFRLGHGLSFVVDWL